SARIYFDDSAGVSDHIKGFIYLGTIPAFILAKERIVSVVNFYFVEVTNNVRPAIDNHFTGQLEVTGNCSPDVIAEYRREPRFKGAKRTVNFPGAPVWQPVHEMYRAYRVVEELDEIGW